ncbi:MAG: hypothetical protein WCE21_02605 [Candidatus Babeliales bacterium]
MLPILLCILFLNLAAHAMEEKEAIVTAPTIFVGIDIHNAWNFLSTHEHSEDTHLISLRQKAYETILNDITDKHDVFTKVDKKLGCFPDNEEISRVIGTRIDEYLSNKPVSPALRETISKKLKNDSTIRNRISRTEYCVFCGNVCIGGMCAASAALSLFLCITGC